MAEGFAVNTRRVFDEVCNNGSCYIDLTFQGVNIVNSIRYSQ